MDSPNQLHIQLLGQFQVFHDERSIALPQSIKARALLLYLLLNNRPISRDFLCNLFWENTTDPRAGLRWALSKLRPVLKEALIAERTTIYLDIKRYSTDVARLNHLLDQTPSALRLNEIETGIDSQYLSGFDCERCSVYQLWLASQRTTLRQLHKQLLNKLIEVSGDNDPDALIYARKCYSLDTCNIESATQMLKIQYLQEGLASALRHLNVIRDTLRKSGLDDTALLYEWRKMTEQQPRQPQSIDLQSEEWQLNDPIPHTSELDLPQKPSLAVIGFKALSGEDAALLAQGMTVDLSSYLSRLGGLFVSSLASSSRFLGQTISPKEIGRLLGVAYLVNGTIQAYKNKFRVTVNLVESDREQTIWSDNYTLDKEEIFLLQDEMISAIVSRIEPEIEYAEYQKARAKTPENLSAWESYHLALWHTFRFTSSNTEIAHNYLQYAIEKDNNFCRAHAALSLVHFTRAFLNTHREPKQEIKLAKEAAKRSIELDSRDAMGHWSLGRALFLDREHDFALESISTSLKANPNYAQGHYAQGFIGAHSGAASQTLVGLDKAIRLSPFDPLLFAMKSSRAISLIAQGNYEEAAHWGGIATQEANAHFHIYAIAAAAYELNGNHQEAQSYVALAKNKHPNYSQKVFFQSFPYKLRSEQEIVAEALTKAGLKNG